MVLVDWSRRVRQAGVVEILSGDAGTAVSADNPLPSALTPSPSGIDFTLAINDATTTALHADYPCKFAFIQNPLDAGIRILIGFDGSDPIFEIEPGRSAAFAIANLNQLHALSNTGNHTINVGALD